MRIQCNHFDLWVETTFERPEGQEEWEYPYKPDDIRKTKKDSAKGFVKGEISCRFYAFPEGKERVKVQVDGPVDFEDVQAKFDAKGVKLSVNDLKAAHGA